MLKRLLGLLPRDSGTIFWNGESVEDPASFMIPPRSAYTPQVPRLFSESLHDNILMGLPPDRVNLEGAVQLAVMERDIEGMDAWPGNDGRTERRTPVGWPDTASSSRPHVRARA